MMNEDLSRVKQDLELMANVTGLGEPPLGKEDVRVMLGTGVLGLVWLGVSVIYGGRPPSAVTLLMAGIFMVGLLTYQFVYTRGKNWSAVRSRAYRLSWAHGAVFFVLLMAYMAWNRLFVSMPQMMFLGTAFVLQGGLLIMLGLTDKWRLGLAGFGLPMLVLGFISPLITMGNFYTYLGATLAFGGFLSAAIIAWQLKDARELRHGAHRL